MTIQRRAAAIVATIVWTGPRAPCSRKAEGAVAGRVHDEKQDRSLGSAQMLLDDVVGAVTDTAGRYRYAAARTGWHQGRGTAHRVSGRGARQRVRARGGDDHGGLRARGQSARARAAGGDGAGRRAARSACDGQRAEDHAADLRELPVSSLEEAMALSAGSVGSSYRGGRIGEESFILDGLGVKNQLDA